MLILWWQANQHTAPNLLDVRRVQMFTIDEHKLIPAVIFGDTNSFSVLFCMSLLLSPSRLNRNSAVTANRVRLHRCGCCISLSCQINCVQYRRLPSQFVGWCPALCLYTNTAHDVMGPRNWPARSEAHMHQRADFNGIIMRCYYSYGALHATHGPGHTQHAQQ